MADNMEREDKVQLIADSEQQAVESKDKPSKANLDAEPKHSLQIQPPKLPFQGGFEQGFYKHFMNPMLANLEESVKKNNEFLDEINRKIEEDRVAERKKRLSKHIPGALQGNGSDLPAIMKHIQDLIMYEDFDDNEKDPTKFVQARLKELDENVEVAILSHSIAAYVSTLDPTHLRQFTNRIVSDTTLWISRLFRFDNSSAYFHEEPRDGLVRVCRLALHQKYPKFASDGYEALYSRPPVIYFSSAAKPGLGQYICTQLGLPLSSLCTVPCNTIFGSQHKMDIATLEKLVQDDIDSGKIPVLMVGYAGTPVVGHVDNVQRLQQICKKHKIWLHIEGNNLATMTLYSVPTSVIPAKSGDSMTLNMGGWLGLPAVPHVTLYKATDPSLAHAAGLMFFNSAYKLNCLPLWLCLQNLGHDGVVRTIQHSISLSKQLSDKITKLPSLKTLGQRPPPTEDTEEKKKLGIKDLITNAISALIIFEIENPTVVFKYQWGTDITEKSSEMTDREIDELEGYLDSLNIWLMEMLRREASRVHITAVEVDGEGVCIRFAPLESAHTIDTRPDDIDSFVECLECQLQILDSTVSQRQEFINIVKSYDKLRLVTIPKWAGLGAIQYIPDLWVESLAAAQESADADDSGGASKPNSSERTVHNLEQAYTDIDNLNSQLVAQLKASDTAFSLGAAPAGDGDGPHLACVRFGLIRDNTDLNELVELVYSVGKEVEDSSRFLETMSDIVRDGIAKANEDLQKENLNKLSEEGVLRQVPVVGSLLNWWSPKAAEVKGRSLNLVSGSIESTETTYKHHMQIQGGNTSTMNGSVVSGSSRGSSRSHSISSNTSHPQAPPLTPTQSQHHPQHNTTPTKPPTTTPTPASQQDTQLQHDNQIPAAQAAAGGETASAAS